jgi:hypothetical protein
MPGQAVLSQQRPSLKNAGRGLTECKRFKKFLGTYKKRIYRINAYFVFKQSFMKRIFLMLLFVASTASLFGQKKVNTKGKSPDKNSKVTVDKKQNPGNQQVPPSVEDPNLPPVEQKPNSSKDKRPNEQIEKTLQQDSLKVIEQRSNTAEPKKEVEIETRQKKEVGRETKGRIENDEEGERNKSKGNKKGNGNRKVRENIPNKVQTAFRNHYPFAQDPVWVKYEDEWSVEFINYGRRVKVSYKSNGTRIN